MPSGEIAIVLTLAVSSGVSPNATDAHAVSGRSACQRVNPGCMSTTYAFAVGDASTGIVSVSRSGAEASSATDQPSALSCGVGSGAAGALPTFVSVPETAPPPMRVTANGPWHGLAPSATGWPRSTGIVPSGGQARLKGSPPPVTRRIGACGPSATRRQSGSL